MLAQWLEEHIEAISDIYLDLRRKSGDPRPEAVIRQAGEFATRQLIKALHNELNWPQSVEAGIEQMLGRGSSPKTLIEGSRLLYLAVQQLLSTDPVPQRFEWLSSMADYMLLSSQTVAQVFHHSLAHELEQQAQETQVFRAMVENSLDAILMIDLQANITYANPAAHRLFKYDVATRAMVGQPGLNFWPPEAAPFLSETLLPAAMAGGWSGEVSQRAGDGSIFMVSASVYPLRDAAGEVTALVASVRDITEQKRAAEELATTQAILTTAIEQIPTGILIADAPSMNIRIANAAALEIRGRLKESLSENSTALHPTEWQTFSPDKSPIPLERLPLSRAIFQGEISHDEEMIIRRENGEDRWVLASAAPICNTAGEIVAGVVVFLDITERKQTETERARLQQQVIEAQQQALKELSTPIIPLLEQIIVMPLIGSIDTFRARELTRALLNGISQYRARVVILDITGVPLVDSGVAMHLNKTIQAARLKGAQTIVTGISDAVAEAVVDLGLDWRGIETLRDLQTGLISALSRLGLGIKKRDNAGEE